MQNRPGKLIMCPTPLGNLGDVTPRILDALRSADVVCCEDTRVTGRLLSALGIEGKRLERLDEATIGAPLHAKAAGSAAGADLGRCCDDPATVGEAVVARAGAGEVIAYCSDAGMPGVSDPGARLVAAARKAGVAVEVLPGPTAVALAYAASGFVCPRFYFGGFFPRKDSERKAAVDFCARMDAVTIFYESPHRLVACLSAIGEALPTRDVAVCRELTKMHEEVAVGPAAQLAEMFADRERAGGIKGEIVVVVDAPGAQERAQSVLDDEARAAMRASELLCQQAMSRKDVAALLQEEFGISRNAAYRLAHE